MSPPEIAPGGLAAAPPAYAAHVDEAAQALGHDENGHTALARLLETPG